MRVTINITPDMVRDECARRLIDYYGARDRDHLSRLIGEDTQILADPGMEVEKREAAQRRLREVRSLGESSKELRSGKIPLDYKDDKWWV